MPTLSLGHATSTPILGKTFDVCVPECKSFFCFSSDMTSMRLLFPRSLAASTALSATSPASASAATRAFPRPAAAKLVQRRNMASQIPKIKVK